MMNITVSRRSGVAGRLVDDIPQTPARNEPTSPQSDSGSEFSDSAWERQDSVTAPRHSGTTASSPNELRTPSLSSRRSGDIFFEPKDLIPQIWRASADSSRRRRHDSGLQLSPIQQKRQNAAPARPTRTTTPSQHALGRAVQRLRQQLSILDESHVREWAVGQVVNWMRFVETDDYIVSTFQRHHIDGAGLLKLRQIDLASLVLGWGKDSHLFMQPVEPQQLEIIRSVSKPMVEVCRQAQQTPPLLQRPSSCESASTTGSHNLDPSQHRSPRPMMPETIPEQNERLSFIGIEELIEEPHVCTKGMRCSTWRRQARRRKDIRKQFGVKLEPTFSGRLYIVDDAASAQAMARVVADSATATLGAGTMADAVPPPPPYQPRTREQTLEPRRSLHISDLEKLGVRDSQDAVASFVQEQVGVTAEDELRRSSTTPEAEKTSPRMTTRQGPSSSPIVPVPAVRSTSKVDVRELPRLDTVTPSASMPRLQHFPSLSKLRPTASPADLRPRPLRSVTAPTGITSPKSPASRFPANSWSPRISLQRSRSLGTRSILTSVKEGQASGSTRQSSDEQAESPVVFGETMSFHGWMRKRTTTMLRHEWKQGHVRLNGSMLTIHATDSPYDVYPLKRINIEDYSIACNGPASQSKLTSVLKALGLSSVPSDSPCNFELVPTPELRDPTRAKSPIKAGKMHHFAVVSDEERQEWMRQVMLAKAAEQKAKGAEVVINGMAMI